MVQFWIWDKINNVFNQINVLVIIEEIIINQEIILPLIVMIGKIILSMNNDYFNIFFSTCSTGSWQCSKSACPRTCTVMGNGHIDTYDGKTYTLIGSCQYTLLEV